MCYNKIIFKHSLIFSYSWMLNQTNHYLLRKKITQHPLNPNNPASITISLTISITPLRNYEKNVSNEFKIANNLIA